MTRLMMAIAASLFALVLTGCGDKDSKPVDADTTSAAVVAPADTTAAPADVKATEEGAAGAEQKPAEEQQDH